MEDAEPGAGAGDAQAAENAAFVMALRGRGLRDTALLRAFERVPRARFARPEHRELARRDIALPLPCGAAMTAPATAAAMLALLRLAPGQSVLEIGTGSGYVTALMADLGAVVTSLERYATLVGQARARLGSACPRVLHADGLAPVEGRYDRILVHGSVPALKPHWLAALEPGGRLVTGLLDAAGGCRVAAYLRDTDGCDAGPTARLAALVPGRALAT